MQHQYGKQDPRLRRNPIFFAVTEFFRKIGSALWAIPVGIVRLLFSPGFYFLLLILGSLTLTIFLIYAGVHFIRKFW